MRGTSTISPSAAWAYAGSQHEGIDPNQPYFAELEHLTAESWRESD
jgi:hypothetical protein